MKRRRCRVLIADSLILSLVGALTLSAKALDPPPGVTLSPRGALRGTAVGQVGGGQAAEASAPGDEAVPDGQLASDPRLRLTGGRQQGGWLARVALDPGPQPKTTTGSPSTSSSCTVSGAVPIGVGDDAQNVVNAHAAGTTYIVKAGTHLRNFSVQPKSGDRFCGEPGAVLDGGRSLSSAFYGNATNVTLDSITVQEYNPGRQGAAIQPQTHASGWVVRNVSALRNGWAGLLAADGMKILGGHYNDNDQLGIGGNEATGVILDGLDDDPDTFDGPELARNHTMHASCEFEAGGMKWDVGQVTIRNVHAHHNDCRGLWADINARGALIEHNLVEDNWAEGVLYEISQDGVIRNNRIYRNGVGGKGWYWDGGITVASSFNVEIYGNRLSGNYNGITGTQQDRPDSTPPAHLLDNLRVHDNLICATAGEHPTGIVADNGANLAARDISFTGNTIQSDACQ